MNTIIKPSRRGFITGLASLVAAPAIVKFDALMPVRSIVQTPEEILNKVFAYMIDTDNHLTDAYCYGQLMYKVEEIDNTFQYKYFPLEQLYVQAD